MKEFGLDVEMEKIKIFASKNHQIGKEIEEDVKKIKEKGITPGLAVILVGDRKDSATYVRMKQQAAEKSRNEHVFKEISSNNNSKRASGCCK